MKNQLRSSFSTQGRRMAGARALWVANGMKKEMMGKPIIAIVNSFTQFVPGHTHLHEIGQQVKAEIEKLGCFAAEFNTIAIDDGIAMGHDGMLYSLPSRDIIADSVEYMVNAHKADAMVCISNCDKITPGMLMAAMRLNIPTVFVSGGPMEAGEWNNQHLDLIDAMIKSADASVSDEDVAQIEDNACPGCGCCSGMFTANSMNCLNEAIGLGLPGNGTILATHANRTQLFKDAAALIVKNAYKYYEEGDDSVLPRSIATRDAFLNAMTLDIAMGGSTNTVLHLLAIAHEAEVDFKMDDIDMLSRHVPCLCKVAPNTQKYHIQDVNRAGGILNILGELSKGGLLKTDVKRVDGLLMGFTQLFSGVLTILGTLLFMLQQNVPITLVVVCITPLSLVVASFLAKHSYKYFQSQSTVRGEQTALVNEMIEGQKVVQAFGHEAQSLEAFDEVNGRLQNVSLKAIFFSSMTNPATRFVNNIVYAGVGLVGAIYAVAGGITIGQLSIFLNYANQYTKPFNEISGVVTELQNALACAARIFELLDAEDQTPEAENAAKLVPDGRVQIEDVSFRYLPDRPLIEGLSLDVKPGQRIAIVGPTGCGKTTLKIGRAHV